MNWKNFGDQKLKRVKQKVKIFIEIKKTYLTIQLIKINNNYLPKKKTTTFDLLVFLIKLF